MPSSTHSPSRLARSIAILTLLVIVVAGIGIALQSSGFMNLVCADENIRDALPAGLLARCPTLYDGQLPSTSADQQPISPAASGAHGIQCPQTGVSGTPAVISWSCGTSVLDAVAGFNLSDQSATEASVIPTANDHVYGIRCADGYQSFCSIDMSVGAVRIWADPPHVRLGARANIFWQADNAQACHVTGPSFDETGIQGGAATVPITVPVTFTATCLTNASTTVSSSVKVDFAQ